MRPSVLPVYTPRASPLHAAGAGPTLGLCAAFALAGLLFVHPLVLGTAVVAIVGAGTAAGVGPQMARALRFALPLAVLVALVNPLVFNEGATVLIRGDVLLGHRFDITLEALAYGAFAGLRVLAFALAFALFSTCVNQDEVLRLFRRVSYRSALTAVLATRLVPVLARDAARMGDAARCRPVQPGRLEVSRAALSGALERAVDVAAALEVRGYSAAVRPARARRPWSRHDRRVAAAAAALALGLTAFRLAGAGSVSPYPTLALGAGPGELACCVLLLAAAALPFAGRDARLGVARA